MNIPWPDMKVARKLAKKFTAKQLEESIATAQANAENHPFEWGRAANLQHVADRIGALAIKMEPCGGYEDLQDRLARHAVLRENTRRAAIAQAEGR